MNKWNLSEWIVESLSSNGFDNPSEVQKETIPKILEGRDMLVSSETGSGKTLAFGLPALEMVDTEKKGVEVLVVCPTRELAIQVNDDIKAIAKAKEDMVVVPLYGGADFVRQIKLVKKGAKIVVGTPGRLIDHIERRTFKMSEVKMIVLDEADEMLNMGFRPDIEKILGHAKRDRQLLMFSATISNEVKKLTLSYQKQPIHIQVGKSNSPIENVRQSFVNVGAKAKKEALMEILRSRKNDKKIIFCNTKKMTQTVAGFLKDNGIQSLQIHGDMDQKERKLAINQFKSSKCNTLVATDVAGRGIDVKELSLVINFDMPTNNEPYIHRIGRTGRAGNIGDAITIINNGDQLRRLKELCASTKTKLHEKIVGCSISVQKKNSARVTKDTKAIKRSKENKSKSYPNAKRNEKYGNGKNFRNKSKQSGKKTQYKR